MSRKRFCDRCKEQITIHNSVTPTTVTMAQTTPKNIDITDYVWDLCESCRGKLVRWMNG